MNPLIQLKKFNLLFLHHSLRLPCAWRFTCRLAQARRVPTCDAAQHSRVAINGEGVGVLVSRTTGV